MRVLNKENLTIISGGLTDEEVESLTAKATASAAKAAFLGLMAVSTKYVTLSAFLVGGVAAPVASLVGTYLFYENKDSILQVLNETKNALPVFSFLS